MPPLRSSFSGCPAQKTRADRGGEAGARGKAERTQARSGPTPPPPSQWNTQLWNLTVPSPRPFASSFGDTSELLVIVDQPSQIAGCIGTVPVSNYTFWVCVNTTAACAVGQDQG